MGVYIPNMEKPKACEKCPMHSFTFGDEYIPSHDDCRSLKKWFNVKKLDIDPFKEILPDCPILDIVTCGECKHWYNDADCGMACEFTNMGQPINGFCSWGERRSDENCVMDNSNMRID